jgi:hypothetical protein
MATPGATIAQRIEDLIGDVYSTIPSNSYKDLINAAFNEVADTLSNDILLKYSVASTEVTSASGNSIEDNKILLVTRVDSSGIKRECKFVDIVQFSNSGDSGSIYFATVYSPVYTIEIDTGTSVLKILPACDATGQEGEIWPFAYALDSTDLTGITAATLNTSHYMPSQIIHAVVLKACINILNAYLSEQIQEEEDIELMGMINSQTQVFEKMYLKEMARFTGKTEAPEGE